MLKILPYITEYWSQITILLLAVGYLFRLYLNYLSRKSEINHSLFQKMMMDAVSEFLKAYTVSEELWRDLPILRISKGEFTPKQLDQMIFTCLNEIKSKTAQLRIFFKDSDMKPFEEIEANLFKLNAKVSEIHANYQMGGKPMDDAYEYGNLKDSLLKKNILWIGEIRDLIHRKFK